MSAIPEEVLVAKAKAHFKRHGVRCASCANYDLAHVLSPIGSHKIHPNWVAKCTVEVTLPISALRYRMGERVITVRMPPGDGEGCTYHRLRT